MLRPCVTYSSIKTSASIDEQFKKAHEAGLECIDFNIDMFLTGDLIRSGEFNDLFFGDINSICEFFRPYKEAAQKYGIEFAQAHAPFQLYVDGRDDINEKCYEIGEKCIALCKYLDCKYLVVHPLNLIFDHDKDYERKINIEYYTRFIPACKKYGVTVCLENMFGTVNRHVTEAVCSDCNEAVYYIDTLNAIADEECFGFCFDIGHMTLLGKNIKESLKTLGGRVKILHIHDNDGIQDHHALPYVYARNWGNNPVTDWNGFIEGLRTINYRGEINFETGTGCKLVPEEARGAVLAYLYAIGQYFAKKILE